MTEQRRKTRGLAELAAGSTAMGAGFGANAIANNVNDAQVRRVDRKIGRLKELGDKGGIGERGELYGSGNGWNPGRSAPYPGNLMEPEGKPAKIAAMKRKTAALKDLGVARKKPVIGPGGRSKLMRGGLAVGAPLVVAGAHRTFVDKAEKRKTTHGDVNAVLAGGAAGGAAPHAAGLAIDQTKEKGWERQVANDRNKKAVLTHHRNIHGLGRGGNTPGTKNWRAFYRSYPKSLPGASYKRAASWALTGPTGVALTAATAAGGAKAALDTKRRVTKAEQMGEYPYLLPSIRQETQIGIPATRLNPISPMQMLASSNIAAEGYLKARSKWPFGRKKRTQAGFYQMGMGAQMGVQPLGHGVMLP